MILYYLDASAWIKRYCAEEGTANVARLFDAGPATRNPEEVRVVLPTYSSP